MTHAALATLLAREGYAVTQPDLRCAAPVARDLAFEASLAHYGMRRRRYACAIGHSLTVDADPVPPPRPVEPRPPCDVCGQPLDGGSRQRKRHPGPCEHAARVARARAAQKRYDARQRAAGRERVREARRKWSAGPAVRRDRNGVFYAAPPNPLSGLVRAGRGR